MKNFNYLAISIFSLFLTISPIQASDTNEEVKKYIVTLNKADAKTQQRAMNSLQWSGISDVELYDLIEEKLDAIYPAASIKSNKVETELASWYIKSLGVSGQKKYRNKISSISTESKSKKLRKYASQALNNLENYKRWNPIISDKTHYNDEQSLTENHFANMLKSNEWELKRIAAKRIYQNSMHGEFLLSILDTQLHTEYANVGKNAVKIDTINWFMKALASSRNSQYKSSLEDIMNDKKSHKKNRKYAKSYIKKYLK